eukprot:350232-Chlamydomonas_euryale.AAC.10
MLRKGRGITGAMFTLWPKLHTVARHHLPMAPDEMYPDNKKLCLKLSEDCRDAYGMSSMPHSCPPAAPMPAAFMPACRTHA